MGKITKEYQIRAPIEKVWQALVSPEKINKWGAGKAKMSEKEGEEFSLWSGDIHGKNVEVVPGKKLIQEWYGGDWPKPSKAIFTLTEREGKTILKLEHTGVPEKEHDAIDQGWDDYYLGPIKKFLE